MVFVFIGAAALAIAFLYAIVRNSGDRKVSIVDVVGAVDGRTVEIMIENRKERVFLCGIGFPRGDNRSEQDCVDTVRETVVGRRLYMEVYREVEGCKYVSLNSSNGDCLNSMMLSKGLARYESSGVGFVGDLIAAESEAKAKGIGIWEKNRALFRNLASSESQSLSESIDEIEFASEE